MTHGTQAAEPSGHTRNPNEHMKGGTSMKSKLRGESVVTLWCEYDCKVDQIKSQVHWEATYQERWSSKLKGKNFLLALLLFFLERMQSEEHFLELSAQIIWLEMLNKKSEIAEVYGYPKIVAVQKTFEKSTKTRKTLINVTECFKFNFLILLILFHFIVFILLL